jgi:hypothetical protein
MASALEIKEKGLVGKIFLPDTTEPRSAIVVLSGSDGGFYENEAKLLAFIDLWGFDHVSPGCGRLSNLQAAPML